MEERVLSLDRGLRADPGRDDMARELASLCDRRPQGVDGTVLDAWRSKLRAVEHREQAWALERLARLGSSAHFAAGELLLFLVSGDACLRARASAILDQIASSALPALLANLTSPSPKIRIQTIRQIGKLEEARDHIHHLRPLIGDPEALVRRVAIDVSAEIGAGMLVVVEDLVSVAASDHEEDLLRSTAILGLAHSPQCAGLITFFLAKFLENISQESLHWSAVHVLHSFGAEAHPATESLIGALRQGDPRPYSPLYRLSEATLAAIGERALPQILNALASESLATRSAAIRLVTPFVRRSSEVEAALKAMLSTERSSEHRLLILEAIGDLDPEDASAELLVACLDENQEVRIQAEAILGRFQDIPWERVFCPGSWPQEVFQVLIDRFETLRQEDEDAGLYHDFLTEGFVLCLTCHHWSDAPQGAAWWQGACWHCQDLISISQYQDWDRWHQEDDGWDFYRMEEPGLDGAPYSEETPARKSRKSQGPRLENLWSNPPWRRGRSVIEKALEAWDDDQEELLRRADRRAWFAVPILIAILSDMESALQKEACQALANVAFRGANLSAALPGLTALVDHNGRETMDDETQAAVLEILKSMGSAAIPLLTRILTVPDKALQRRAVEVLGLQGPRAIGALPNIKKALDPWWDRGLLSWTVARLRGEVQETSAPGLQSFSALSRIAASPSLAARTMP